MAQLHIGLLARQRTRNNVRSALERLPDGLDDVYDAVIDRIKSQSSDDTSLALKILSWITYAKVPLGAAVLQHAVVVTENIRDISDDDLIDVEDLVSVCAGIVTVDRESGIIRLIHYTTQKYLQNYLQRQLPTTDANIAMTCLVYLGFDIFGNSCQSKSALEQRLKKYKFYSYAAQYWGEHTRGGLENDDSIQAAVIETFFQTSGKLESMNQVRVCLKFPWRSLPKSTGRTLLHVIAEDGLSMLLKEREYMYKRFLTEFNIQDQPYENRKVANGHHTSKGF